MVVDISSECSTVDIWYLRNSQPNEVTSILLSYLTDEEKEHASSYFTQELTNSYICSRGGLRFLLSQYINTPLNKVVLKYTEHKKPFIENSEIKFNVSHSGEYVIYAVIKNANALIGIDIEQLKKLDDLDEIAKHHFTDAEYKSIQDQARPEDKLISFYRCWTRKEAAIKAIGTGLYFPLDNIEVTCSPCVLPEILKFVGFADPEKTWCLKEIIIDHNYIASLAIDKPISKLNVREFIPLQDVF